jgi:hypothetical protein
MEIKSQNFIKNYVLEKFIDFRLFFIRQSTVLTDFFENIQRVKKILVILPVDRAEEIMSREYLPEIKHVFGNAKVETLDPATFRKIDTNWLGVPNQKYIAHIQNQKFDFCLDLNSHHESICAYLCARSEVPMRLHISEGRFEKIYNLHFRVSAEASLRTRYQNFLTYIGRMRQKPL